MDDGADTTPLIEVGWVLLGRFDATDREALEVARERTCEYLQRSFPRYRWLMPRVERGDLAMDLREEIVDLLDQGVVERQAKRWDFALVVTASELNSFYKPFALGAPARSLAAAVLSTSRVDPSASGRGRHRGERGEILAHRISSLALHLFGHLNGLEHGEEAWDYMAPPSAVEDLDTARRFSEAAVAQLDAALADVADVRLEEERHRVARTSRFRFYVRAAWHNRQAILGSIRHAKPWQFPFRLSRLTTAAVSALLVFVITAEAWDLGMSQSPTFVAVLSAVVLVGTSAYTLARQHLLVRRAVPGVGELTVVGNVSMAVSVFLGMLTTYLGLFLLTLAVANTFFSHALVEAWAASVSGRIGRPHYVVFASFVASLGLLVGALGASFEEQRYFRHVAIVDEET